MARSDRNLRKTLPLTAATVIAMVVGLLGYLRADPPPGHDRIYLRSGSGPVLFTHARHADLATDCVTCHHELAQDVDSDCADCHGEGSFEADDFDHADLLEIPDHECAGCHSLAEPTAARSCRGCHLATAEGPRIEACTDCHDDEYEPGLFSHAELLEVEDHTCESCHHPVAVAEAYHDLCNTCHLDAAADRFATADGQVQCAGCHLR